MKHIPLKYIKEAPGVGNADDSTYAEHRNQHSFTRDRVDADNFGQSGRPRNPGSDRDTK